MTYPEWHGGPKVARFAANWLKEKRASADLSDHELDLINFAIRELERLSQVVRRSDGQ